MTLADFASSNYLFRAQGPVHDWDDCLLQSSQEGKKILRFSK